MKNTKNIILLAASMTLASCEVSGNSMAGKSFSKGDVFVVTYGENSSREGMFFEEAPFKTEKEAADRLYEIFVTNDSHYQENGKMNFTDEPGFTNMTFEGKTVSTWALNYGKENEMFSTVRCYYTNEGGKGVFLSVSKTGAPAWERWSSGGFIWDNDFSYTFTFGNATYTYTSNSLVTEVDMVVTVNSSTSQTAHFALNWTL
ncbi:MAG: hypothetical protein MJ239_03625 [Bacilli bacterium]|nr:hypothetical protein [Bacilli bacterium]